MVQRRRFLVLALLFLAPVNGAHAAPKFGPAEMADAVHANQNDTYHYVVRGEPAGLVAAKQLSPATQSVVALPLIDGELLTLKEIDAEALEARPDIAQVYYVRAELADTYTHVIEALTYAVKTAPAPGVINMSLGPDSSVMPLATQADDPINLATQKAADKGLVPVMAIGNYFVANAPNPGVTNPWCRVAWVICVGAVNRDATTLYEASSRGAPEDPSTWPDVVAYGVDVLSDWPEHTAKSALQQAQDQGSAEWRALPEDQRATHAVMSGTSQATAQVSRAAAQVVFFFKNAAMAANADKGGDPIFTIEIPKAQFDLVSRRGPRLTGDVAHPSPDIVSVTYRLDQPWKIVKQILIDTATPLPAFDPQDAGAGFVAPDFIDAQFGNFQVGQPRIMPLKIAP